MRFVVVGTGDLARAVCCALAVAAPPRPLAVTVLGRSVEHAAEVCYLAGARAALAGCTAITFHPGHLDTGAAADTGAIAAALAGRSGSAGPDGVLLCASTQSPWERLTAPSAWTALVGRAGFGLTMPLHAELATRVGAALVELSPRPWLVNACFPDAVNPLLVARAVPVLCGIGNVGLLAASLQAALGLPDQRRLRVLAHHLHLHTPAGDQPEAMAWQDERPVERVTERLAAQRATPRQALNQVTGHSAALLLGALLSGADIDTNLPGPLGLPGGYPVRLRGGRVELRLPDGVSQHDAVAFNQRAASHDGVVVDNGTVRFGPAASTELDRLAPELAGGFEVVDLPVATQQLHALRARLRARPAGQDNVARGA